MAVLTSRTVAFHEAGHALGALLCGEAVYALHCAHADDAVFIDWHGRDAKGSCGLCETAFQPFRPDYARSRLAEDDTRWGPVIWARAVNHAFFCGAGPMAELKGRGLPFDSDSLASVVGVQQDFERAMMGFEPFEPDVAERTRMVWALWNGAAPIISQPQIWQAISIFAQKAIPFGSDPVRLPGEALKGLAGGYLRDLPDSPLMTVMPQLANIARLI